MVVTLLKEELEPTLICIKVVCLEAELKAVSMRMMDCLRRTYGLFPHKMTFR